MKSINLLGLTARELESVAVDLGSSKYKGRQLFKWLYKKRETDFRIMTDLSLELRNLLKEKYCFRGLNAEEIFRSSDGTEKTLFRLDDNLFIETVRIPDKDKATACVSSQVGCPLGCRFCATGKIGFRRNLSTGEIIGQLLFLRDRYGRQAFDNVVFMGMGEPLLNYKNTLKAVEIISSEIGLSISAKRITISTVGITPQIIALADSGIKANLAISLHAATDEKRRRLVPAAQKYPLHEIAEAAKYFARKRKKRVTFEYILFKGINDGGEDILELANLTKGIPCKINILAYNPVPGLPYARPSNEEINSFSKALYPRAPAVTVRKSRGMDIEAACGQLAGKSLRTKS
jgi:23S rRNA (adenine2503-C2)-methyltransferase